MVFFERCQRRYVLLVFLAVQIAGLVAFVGVVLADLGRFGCVAALMVAVAWLLVLLQLGALERLQAAVTHFDVQASVAEVRVSMGSRRLNRVLISDRIRVLQTFEILYRLIQNGIVRRSDLGDDEGALALLVFVA